MRTHSLVRWAHRRLAQAPLGQTPTLGHRLPTCQHVVYLE